MIASSGKPFSVELLETSPKRPAFYVVGQSKFAGKEGRMAAVGQVNSMAQRWLRSMRVVADPDPRRRRSSLWPH
jgi:hypothetical protein